LKKSIERNKEIEKQTLKNIQYHNELDRALKSINEYSGFGTIVFMVYDKKIVNCKPQATKDISK